jgi:hypothetical protein
MIVKNLKNTHEGIILSTVKETVPGYSMTEEAYDG